MAVELKCAACGESSPSGFDLCWNCGESLANSQRVEQREDPEEGTQDERVATEESRWPPPQTTEVKWSTWCEVIAVLLATCVPYLVIHHEPSQRQPPQEAIDALLFWVPRYAGLSGMLWFLMRRDRSVAQPQSFSWRLLWQEVVLAMLILVGQWALDLCVRALAGAFGLASGVAGNPEAWYISGGRLFALAFYSLFAAAYEEILFRVYLQSKLQLALGGRRLAAIGISAVLFSMMHHYSVASSLVLFADGVFFGILYDQSRAVPRLVIAHWIHNVIVMTQRARLIS